MSAYVGGWLVHVQEIGWMDMVDSGIELLNNNMSAMPDTLWPYK